MKKRMVAGLLAVACLMAMCSCGLSLNSKKRDVDQQTTTAHADKQKKETKDSLPCSVSLWPRAHTLSK